MVADTALVALSGALGGAAIAGGLGFGGLIYVTRRQTAAGRREELLAAATEFLALADELANRFLRSFAQKLVHGSGRDVNDVLHDIARVRARLELIEPTDCKVKRDAFSAELAEWSDKPGTAEPPGVSKARTIYVDAVRSAAARAS